MKFWPRFCDLEPSAFDDYSLANYGGASDADLGQVILRIVKRRRFWVDWTKIRAPNLRDRIVIACNV